MFAIGRNDRYCPSPVNMTLDERRTNTNMLSMDSRDCLAQYPFVVVRIRCRVCARKGSYRLARIALPLRWNVERRMARLEPTSVSL